MVVCIIKEFLRGFIPSKWPILIAIVGLGIGYFSTIITYPTNFFSLGETIPSFKSSVEIELIPLKYVLFNNLTVSFMVIITGELVIVPYIILILNFAVIGYFYTFMVLKSGFTSLLLLHGYFELWALMLTLDPAMHISKIGLKKYKKQLDDDINLKELMVGELMSSFPRIALILVIAALLEIFWVPVILNEFLGGV